MWNIKSIATWISLASWSYFKLMLWMSKHKRIDIEIISLIFLFKICQFHNNKTLLKAQRETLTGSWIHSHKSNRLGTWLNPKQNPSQIGVHLLIFLKTGLALLHGLLNIESIIFWKPLREMEVAAICFVIWSVGLEYNTHVNTGKTDLSGIKRVWLIQMAGWSVNQRTLKILAESLRLFWLFKERSKWLCW